MPAALILILAVAVAYLAAHVAFDWLAKRFMLVSGAEYLLLGILLGPHVSGILSAQTMSGFAPLITLALGWIGAIVGTQFYLPALVRIPARTYRLGFLEAILTAFMVGGVGAALMWLITGRGDITQSIAPALALGAIAAVSAPAGIEVVTRKIGGQREPIVLQLQVATAMDALVGIVTMGLLFCIFHPNDTIAARGITPTEWAVITLGIGVVGGTLFHLFLGGETNVDRLFISLAGAIILASGAAAYLHLSPVLTSMVVGAVLVNTSGGSRPVIADTLAKSERPFYFVLLVFAGASWDPSTVAWWWAVVLAFLVTRVVGKIGTARLGARVNDALPDLGPDWGFALLGQGGLAIALGLDYSRFSAAVLPHAVFTAAIVSVLFTDVGSARIIHAVMSRLRWRRSLDDIPGNPLDTPPVAATGNRAENQ
jgi:Kef-type K+ transport system membrane component KefB